MDSIEIKKTSRVITDCFSFEKDSSTIFNIEFTDFRPTSETYVDKTWNTRSKLEKYFRHIFVDKKQLSQELQKKSNSEICQAIKWKKLYINTLIWD